MLFQGLRYRERGPMKSWRSETMAEAIWSVLQEGLSLSQVGKNIFNVLTKIFLNNVFILKILSQAARKHDIPYPTFVLYANRVHNMLGPSPLNGYGIGGEDREDYLAGLDLNFSLFFTFPLLLSPCFRENATFNK